MAYSAADTRINNLINGNISDFHAEVAEMTRKEISQWFFWLIFNAKEEYGEIDVTMAIGHTCKALEV
jgi:hypothetical protein